MKNRWNEKHARDLGDDALQLRIYTSRLLGADPDLVLHGGGNTSVKTESNDLFDEPGEILFVKGSGVNLSGIDKDGFAAVRMAPLLKLLKRGSLDDTDLVRLQRAACVDPDGPNPSVEAIVHASIPFRFVDHTHADAVVTLTNTPDGPGLLEAVYGGRVAVIPYVMPGFALAKSIQASVAPSDWQRLEGLILAQHGVITFGNDAGESYSRMIQIVSEAEDFLRERGGKPHRGAARHAPDRQQLRTLADIRREVSRTAGGAMFALLDTGPEAAGFAGNPAAVDAARRGPLTPDHVSRTRHAPALIEGDITASIRGYAEAYAGYVDRHRRGELTMTDAAPRWAIWPDTGLVAFGRTLPDARVVADIGRHTVRAVQWAEGLGGWRPLDASHLFDIEYWPPQMAKFAAAPSPGELAGRVALVTGAASGIGRACVEALADRGAAVVAVDIDPVVSERFDDDGRRGVVCDVTDGNALGEAVDTAVRTFGGLDIVVSNAGIFPDSATLDNLGDAAWERSLAINLTAAKTLLHVAIPFLRHGLDAAVVFVGSKNVPAPGKGAAAYSVAKAGLTQLARVAALELAPSGIRVNVVHPNNVFDTGIWTPEVLAARARHYGMTVDAYRRNSLLGVEVTSADVARLVCAMAGPPFAKTTGAQVPIDGGNDRVI